jgi:hypothetical protein
MGSHTVVLGDCFSSVARKSGLQDYKSVYDHAQNATLKAKRPNPNQLERGDVILVPPAPPPAPAKTKTTTKFQLPKHPVKLNLVLLDDADKPAKGIKWNLSAATVKHSGTTGNDGRISIEIAADLDEATLTFSQDAGKPRKKKATAPSGKPAKSLPAPVVETEFIDADDPASAPGPRKFEFKLKVGALASFNTVDGSLGRLRNLGFGVSAEEGGTEPATRAVKLYQKKYSLGSSGAVADIQADVKKRHDDP